MSWKSFLLRSLCMPCVILLCIGLLACSNESEEALPSDHDPSIDLSENEAPPAPTGMVLIPAGTFGMGSSDGLRHELPVHEVYVDAFYMDIHEVTNDQFAVFVQETGYVSEAEQWGWSLALDLEANDRQRVVGAEWWAKVDGADWRHPAGPGSSIEGKGLEPVVQVSWNDAVAYCKWAGKRLPTEAEWEYAGRGGLGTDQYPWGNDFEPNGASAANTWEGNFPAADSGSDGYTSLAPVKQYPPNGYGLFDMGGNVWEWCEDWYAAGYYVVSPRENPPGPGVGLEKILRGGSWLCSPNYCHGYRVSHRNKSGIDTGLNHVGFRCVQSVADIGTI